MGKKIIRNLWDFTLLAAGSTVLALAFTLFLIPHNVVPGGVSGISMVLHHFLGTPIGLMNIVLNVPLFFLGVRVLGGTYGLKSLVGMLTSSLLIDFFTYIVPINSATHDPILACIFGGLMLGAGLGLVFRGGGSTGGSDIIGMVLNRWTSLSTGTAILIVDCLVISAAGAAFNNFELSLYGFVNLYISTRVIDLVVEGVSFTRAVYIISDKSQEITRAIFEEMGRGVTLLHGMGAFSQQSKEVVFCVMSKKEVQRARNISQAIDPRVFLIITEVYEVLGEGFRPRT